MRHAPREGRTPEQWLLANAIAVAAFFTVDAVAAVIDGAGSVSNPAVQLMIGFALAVWGVVLGLRAGGRGSRVVGAIVTALVVLLLTPALVTGAAVQGAQDSALSLVTQLGEVAFSVGYWASLVMIWRRR